MNVKIFFTVVKKSFENFNGTFEQMIKDNTNAMAIMTENMEFLDKKIEKLMK